MVGFGRLDELLRQDPGVTALISIMLPAVGILAVWHLPRESLFTTALFTTAKDGQSPTRMAENAAVDGQRSQGIMPG